MTEFSSRTENILINMGFCFPIRPETLAKFSERELLNQPNFGRKSLNEVKDWLKARGLKLTEPARQEDNPESLIKPVKCEHCGSFQGFDSEDNRRMIMELLQKSDPISFNKASKLLSSPINRVKNLAQKMADDGELFCSHKEISATGKTTQSSPTIAEFVVSYIKKNGESAVADMAKAAGRSQSSVSQKLNSMSRHATKSFPQLERVRAGRKFLWKIAEKQISRQEYNQMYRDRWEREEEERDRKRRKKQRHDKNLRTRERREKQLEDKNLLDGKRIIDIMPQKSQIWLPIRLTTVSIDERFYINWFGDRHFARLIEKDHQTGMSLVEFLSDPVEKAE